MSNLVHFYCSWCRTESTAPYEVVVGRYGSEEKLKRFLQKRRDDRLYVVETCKKCEDLLKKNSGGSQVNDTRDNIRGQDRTPDQRATKPMTEPTVCSSVDVQAEVTAPQVEPTAPERSMNVFEQAEGPTPSQEPESAEVVEAKYGIKWGVIGSGQAGSRLAEQFAERGYPACCINTAQQDLAHINLPDSHKLHMDFGLGGVGKDLNLGAKAIEEYAEEVKDLVSNVFADDVDMFIVTAGLGGGTGSGSIIHLVNILKQYGLPVLALITLPMSNEGTVTKSNSIKSLDLLAQAATSGSLSGLMVIDNARVEMIYADVSSVDLWPVANADIVDILHSFNRFSALSSGQTSLDPMDFAKIITAGNCAVYGKVEIDDFTSPTSIAKAILQRLDGNILAEGFDLKETVRAGVIIVGDEEILKQIPSQHISYAFTALSETIGSANIFRGIYTLPSDLSVRAPGKGKLMVYTLFSGLGLPRDRIQTLIAESKVEVADMDAKTADSSKMVVEATHTSTDIAKDIFKQIAAEDQPLERMVARRKKKAPRRTRN